MKQRRSKKGGFTVLEMVIAMAVVVIVTATAVTLVLSSRKAETRVLRNADATRLAENVWECFKATDSETDFLAAVEYAEGITPEGESGTYTLTPERYGYTAALTLDGESLQVVIIADGDEFLSFSYRKGEGTP